MKIKKNVSMSRLMNFLKKDWYIILCNEELWHIYTNTQGLGKKDKLLAIYNCDEGILESHEPLEV